jgi:hypothetical protein
MGSWSDWDSAGASISSVFIMFAAVFFVGAVAVLILGEETRGVSLEEIAE